MSKKSIFSCCTSEFFWPKASSWEGEPRSVAVFHGLAPMGESWRAAPERGYSLHFAEQRPVTYVSPETMAASTGATLPLPSKTQDFHLIRPVRALGTFPSRGRLANAFLFLVLWFFDSLKKVCFSCCAGGFCRTKASP